MAKRRVTWERRYYPKTRYHFESEEDFILLSTHRTKIGAIITGIFRDPARIDTLVQVTHVDMGK